MVITWAHWESLGAPFGVEIGAPVAQHNQDGRLEIFGLANNGDIFNSRGRRQTAVGGRLGSTRAGHRRLSLSEPSASAQSRWSPGNLRSRQRKGPLAKVADGAERRGRYLEVVGQSGQRRVTG